jgi:hypothetical protein
MKKFILILLFLSMVLPACGQATPEPTQTQLPSLTPTITETPTPLPTETPTLTQTPTIPPGQYGPANFPANVDPLTGLKVANPALLDRRPMVIKVSNLPRYVRPQWGLSLADLVFEYYTEEGTTRFAAVFYGKDAEMVGPIRSGRFIDAHLVSGYKALFAFGFADPTEMGSFMKSDFANRIVVEGPGSPLKYYDPKTSEFLIVGTADLSAYLTKKGVENGRQDVNGMFFKPEAPAGGQPAPRVFVRYSGSIYNRWDFDPVTGKSLRSSDTADAINITDTEKYVQLTDRLTKKPIAFENVVVLLVDHQVYSPGIYDIKLIGSGNGYALRDGQIYPVIWVRDPTTVVSLENPDGTPFAVKPGSTWFEVVGTNSTVVKQADKSWRFTHIMP